MKFILLKRNHRIIHLFEGGHKRRVKQYNNLVSQSILLGPERFTDLSVPLREKTFLLEDGSDLRTCEPKYYYPTDEPSIEFWNQVHETERMMARLKFARFWRQRAMPLIKDPVNETISPVVFKMNHQYAKVLLLHNLHFLLK